jgi:prepilin-type N-terminal cleavage/methylation domain-containing protein
MRKGFTLIELLVVIAIIGLLSSVVLASLNTARGKGANASVKSNLNNIRAQAELVYDRVSPNSYDTVCNGAQDANVAKGVAAARVASGSTGAVVNTFTTAQTGGIGTGTTNCHSSVGAWAVSAPLKAAEGTSIYWCVDSTGTSAARINPLPASSAVCPAA